MPRKKNYSQDAFLNELLNNYNTIKLNTIFDTDNVDLQTTIFTETFIFSLDAIAPIRTVEMKRPPAPWITPQIKQEIHLKRQLQLASKQSNDALELFKRQKLVVRKLIKQAKATHFHKELQATRTNSKETWKILKRVPSAI